MNKHQIHDRVLKALWRWADGNDFQFRPTPRIVTATGACENVDTLWAVGADCVPGDYFFAQTGQLYLEMGLSEVPRAFTMGSSGRAEAEIDHRHLREFTLLEIEGRGGFDELVATIKSLFSAIDRISIDWGAPPIASRLRIVRYLQDHECVGKVFYPGLPTHEGHEIAARQMDRFGAVVSFELEAGVEETRQFARRLKLWTLAESLGSVKSLFCHPATMTHASVEPEIRRKVGISDGLLRLSVGLEDPRDLIDDLDQALVATRVALRSA